MSILLRPATAFLMLTGICAAVSCRVPPGGDLRPAAGEYSVMTFNLFHYGLEDRDEDGQRNDPKPLAARTAVMDVIARVRPDILLVQEIGSPPIYAGFRDLIAESGLEYAYDEYLRVGPHENNIALLSRYPIVSRQSHTNDTYTIGGTELRVARGIIDVEIEVEEGCSVRIMGAHLKSKVYHPLGQTEMRRNEARILGQHIRGALKDDPELKLLVAGDLNDDPDSAALREVLGTGNAGLIDLRPLDLSGDAWTQVQLGPDLYGRIDYLLASKALAADVVPGKNRIVDIAATRIASDHRPLVATFRKRP